MLYLFLFFAGLGASILYSERDHMDLNARARSVLEKYGFIEAVQKEYHDKSLIVYMRQGIHVSGEMEFSLEEDKLLLQDETTQYVILFKDILHITIDPLAEGNSKKSFRKRHFHGTSINKGYYVAIAYRNTAKKFKLVTLHFPFCSSDTLEKLNRIV